MSAQHYEFACTKEPFASAELAHKVARRDARRKGRMSVYRCKICNGWHLGHAKVSTSTRKYRK